MTEPVEAPPTQPLAPASETTQPVAPVTTNGQTQPMSPVTPDVRTQPMRTDEAPSSEPPPRLADGVELIGRAEGSGYKEPPFMARRPDGQMVQLAPILYLVAERADGGRSYEQIGAEVSEVIGRGLDGDGVRMLAQEKLRPLGILTGPDGAQPQIQKQDPFLGLKLKTALIPARVVRAITALFRPLFWPPVILAVLAGLVVFDLWFFLDHGVAQSLRQLLYQPLYLILTFGFIVLSAAFHETGHATGCRYGGAKPGVMGAGIYIIWPAFYTDVTDSYRLGRGGKLRTDLGGVYFNAIFILAMAGAYFATGFEPLLIPVFLAHLEIFRQLLPLVRLDGYHVLADITGVPDLFARIKPILVSLVPWKRGDQRVTQLKPWVRVVVTLWVLIFIPFLALNVAYILVFAPRIFATGWDSFTQHLGQTSQAFGAGDGAAGAAGVIRLLALALPAIGIAFGFGRAGGRLVKKLGTTTREHPFAGLLGWLVLAGAIAGVVALWWPDADYAPIREGERFTVTEAAGAVSRTAAGETAFVASTLAPERRTEDEGPAIETIQGEDGDVDVETESPTTITTTPSPDGTEDVVEPTPLEPSPEPTSESPSPEPTTVEPTTEPSPETSPVTP